MLQSFSPVHAIILALSLVVFAAVIWAIVITLADKTLDVSMKIVWTILLFFIPIIGLLLWLIVRPARRNRPALEKGP